MPSPGIARLRALGVEIAEDHERIDRGPSRYSPNAPPIGLGSSPRWSLHGRSPAFLALFDATAFYSRWHSSEIRDHIERHDAEAADEITLLLADLCEEQLDRLAREKELAEPPAAPLDAPRVRASTAPF